MKQVRKTALEIPQYAYLILITLSIALPLYLTIVNSMKTTAEVLTNYFDLPGTFDLSNYITVLKKANYFVYLKNSLIITVISAIGVYLVVPATSFVITRRMENSKYFKFLYFYIILGTFVPFQVKMLALVKWMSALHLMNTTGLILLYIFSSMCQNVFLLVGFIKQIPVDMEEASLLDGCSRLKTIFKIIYPVIKPMLAAIIIKDTLWFWNDFLMPLVIIGGKLDSWTLQMFQYNFKGTYSTDYPLAYAAYTMSMLPVVICYLFASRQITEGLTEGAVKS